MKSHNFVPKLPFFLNLETALKMAKETNKGEVESKCARVAKSAPWRTLKLIWIDYEQLIKDCFDCIIFTINLVYFIPMPTGFMIFVFFAAPAPRVWTVWNIIKTLVWNGLRFFLYTEVKFSY